MVVVLFHLVTLAYEVGTVFYGPNWEHNKEAHDFTVEIVKRMHDWCAYWEKTKKYHYHYSVYSTPSESLTDRFCVLDTEKFGKVKDITDKEYYTNSFHYDVRKHPTPFEKLEFEKDYPPYAAGGFIHYCEHPNLKQNPKLWKLYGTLGTIKLVILVLTPQLTAALSVVLLANLKQLLKDLNAQYVAIMILKLVTVSSVLVAT